MYFWKPASVNISANDTIIEMVATTPNASGVSNLAKTMAVIGVINLANNSANVDHLVADRIL